AFADTGLTAGTTYRYWVRAEDAAGNLSPWSAIVNATTPTPTQITFVQSTYSVPQTPQATVTARYPAAQAAGDTNVVVIGWNDAASQYVKVTDCRGNLY